MPVTVNRAMSQYVSDTTSDLFIRDVSAFPKLIKRRDTPLTKLLRQGAPMNQPKLKLEWGIRSNDPYNDTLSAAIADGVTTTITPVNIGYYMVNHVLQIDNEQLLVTAVGASTLTVVRGFAGTTGAAHSNAAGANGIRIIGIATKENADSPLGPITQGDLDYNYFQIFDEMVQFSHRARVTPTYEQMDDRLLAEVNKKLEDTIPVLFENALLWGVRSLGSTTVPSSMGGVFTPSYISTVVAAAGAAFTEYQFMEAIQQAYNLVGSDAIGKTVMAHPFYKRVFGSWYNNARVLDAGTSRISNVFDQIETDFGVFTFIPHYMMTSIANPALPDGRVLIFDPEDYEVIPYDDEARWAVWAVSVAGWYDRRAIRGDYALRATNPERRVAITGLSTTATDYAALVNA